MIAPQDRPAVRQLHAAITRAVRRGDMRAARQGLAVAPMQYRAAFALLAYCGRMA